MITIYSKDNNKEYLIEYNGVKRIGITLIGIIGRETVLLKECKSIEEAHELLMRIKKHATKFGRKGVFTIE